MFLHGSGDNKIILFEKIIYFLIFFIFPVEIFVTPTQDSCQRGWEPLLYADTLAHGYVLHKTQTSKIVTVFR